MILFFIMNIRCFPNLQARTGKEKVGRDGETDGETKTDRKRKGGTKTENDGTKRGDYTFRLLNYWQDES